MLNVKNKIPRTILVHVIATIKSFQLIQSIFSIEPFPANISCFPRRLENVFRISISHLSRYLQDVFQDNVFKASSRRIFKTSSSRRLQYRCLARKSWRCLQRNNISSFKMSFPDAFQDDVFKMSSRRAFKNTSCKHVLKTSWKDCFGRRHEDVLEGNNILPWRHLEDVFNMPSLKRMFSG